MTIKENLILPLINKTVRQNVLQPGKEYKWVDGNGNTGILPLDKKIARLKVYSDDIVILTLDWQDKNEHNTEDTGDIVHVLRESEISGFKVPSRIPGLKKELAWTPSNK